jgi:GT2 family glycosyltransferase
MPPRSPRLQFPRQVVTAVVVVHDGDRWLPRCLDAIRDQRRRPQRLVVVDTGSVDGSAEIAAAAGDEIELVRLPRDTGFPSAVAAGLAAADARPGPRARGPVTDRVWLLHDDCRPEPDALFELLAEVERSESATVLGCKQIDLAGRHLVEMGVTVDGSGRRRTGLDPHEVDQGQHDELRDVLAVSTAGLLVRRDVWDRLGGLDPAWPLFGDDVDFGWRANAAGERVVVVPSAVVRHDFAVTTGQRLVDAVADRPEVARRRHELQVLLANTASVLVPLVALRVLFTGLFTAAGRLLGGHARAALDEVSGVGSALRDLPAVAAARRRRRPTRVRPHREIRPLLARGTAHGRRDLEALLARLRRRHSADAGRRSWRDRPLLLLTIALLAVAAIADRRVLGGVLHGGRLLPAPGGASDLWSLYRAGWHGVGVGSTASTPAWVAVLAALSTVLFGKPWLVVELLILASVPLAGWSAYAAGSAVTGSRWLRAWAAGAYALLPVTTGAVAGGRLDVTVVVVVLPLTALALVHAVRSTTWSAPIAAGLLLAVGAAFAPLLWAVTAVVGFAVVAVALRPVGPALARLTVALAAAFVALVPWSWSVAAHPSLALRGLGLVDTFTSARPQPATELLLLHPGGPALPPTWLVVGYLLAAVVGLCRSAGRRLAHGGFAALVVAVAVAVVVSRLDVPGDIADARYWTGVPLAVAGLAAICCATVGADDARTALARHSFGWRQATAALVSAAAVVATVGTVLAWAADGADPQLTARNPQLLPAFAAATVGLPAAPRALVVRANGDGVVYTLVRSSAGPRLGDADLAAGTGRTSRLASADLTAAVARLAAGDADAAPLLAAFGITQVVTRLADDRRLPGLAQVDGLTAVRGSGVVVRRTAASSGELVVLDPDAAGRAGTGQGLASADRPEPLPAADGRAAVRLPAGPAGRLLVLAEPADPHWRATVDGRPLHRSTAYGWAQAWTLPPGGGRLQVTRSSDGRGRLLLLELAALVVLVLAARPRSRTGAVR